MRRLALFAALTVGALPTTASAQPAASDAALIDEVVAALRSSDPERPSHRAPRVVHGVPWVDGSADSVRAAFAEDFRPDLLVEALGVLESPAYRRVDAASRGWLRRQSPGDLAALARYGSAPPGSPLADAPLADSALVADYVEAMVAAARPPDVRAEMWADIRAALPDATAEAVDRAKARAEDGAPEDESADAARPSLAATVARYQLAGVDPAYVGEIADFYRSEAGRYVGRRAAVGAARAAVPFMVQTMVLAHD